VQAETHSLGTGFWGEEDHEDDLETYYSDDLAGKFRKKFRSRINLLRGFLEDFE